VKIEKLVQRPYELIDRLLKKFFDLPASCFTIDAIACLSGRRMTEFESSKIAPAPFST